MEEGDERLKKKRLGQTGRVAWSEGELEIGRRGKVVMSGGEDEDKMVAGGKVVWKGIFSLKTLSCQRVDNTNDVHGSEAWGSVITVVHREKGKKLRARRN